MVSVDLASKFSAFCCMDKDGQVLTEENTGKGILAWWIREMLAPFSVFSESQPKILLIEDLPHGVPYREVVKEVCRIQGRILQEADKDFRPDAEIWFIQPQLWQRHFEGVYRGGPGGAAAAALALGYEPPDLLTGTHGKDRVTARKLMTDHVDSFLMGRWFCDKYQEHGSTDAILAKEKRVTRYGKEG